MSLDVSLEIIIIAVLGLTVTVLAAISAKFYSDLTNQRRFYDEKIKDITEGNDNLILKFKDISAEVLKNQALSFDERQRMTLESIVNPFKNEISDFKTKIDAVHKDSIVGRTSLDSQLRNLMDLNRNLSKEAQNLTEALKGRKKLQGDWGELQLARILEMSGLQEGVAYRMQVNLKDENGSNLRPDCIVYMPSDRKVIIDSKVSLNDYVEYINTENEEEKNKYLESYIKCLRKHIDELANKNYQSLIRDNSLDYVMMFVPVESAYIEAVKKDINLFDYAYKNKVAIATPSSLMPLLKLVESMWRVDKQSRSALQMAQTASSLYDKIANFSEDMRKVGDSLDRASSFYDEALRKLSSGRGNVLSLAQRMIDLGATSNKKINIDFEDGENDDKDKKEPQI
jgi:DNA recombination protein RmuC